MAMKQSAPRKIPSPGWNLLLVFLMLALFAYAIYALYSERNTPVNKQIVIFGKSAGEQRIARLEALSRIYDEQTIEYRDPAYGYAVRYPIGYIAVMNPYPGIHQRFAAMYPPYEMELFEIRIVEKDSFTPSSLQAAAAEEKLSFRKETINGRNAFLLESEEQNPVDENQTIYIRQAFYQCIGPEKKEYWLSFSAAITEALVADLELTEYMVWNLKC